MPLCSALFASDAFHHLDPAVISHRPLARGTWRTAFAGAEAPTADELINMLNPELKKIVQQHPEMINQFAGELKGQLETMKLDPDGVKMLRDEMAEDIKQLNSSVAKDPSMLKNIEQTLSEGGGLSGVTSEGLAPVFLPPPSMPGGLRAVAGARRRAQTRGGERRLTMASFI
eukprot:TRINITY_DN73756_c0_g1_i1.p2 TRINITY_DN73756_c0_g1~~TRINITY_DN73756_c0_g1_i1.p2  ORF type:complete len:188 (+),score=50.18 TRINITY_DN73756_c0_g1_i1:51-566(+)